MKKNPVVISKISLSALSQKLTGVSEFKDLNTAKVFGDLNDEELVEVIVEMHNNKLTEEQIAGVEAMTKKEKRNLAVNALTCSIEFSQLVNEGENQSADPLLNLLLIGRVNSLNITQGRKLFWKTSTIEGINTYGIEEGANFEFAGKTVYIQRITSTTPVVRDGKITSSPKRMGKGGDILLKDKKMLFQSTEMIILDGDVYEDLAKQESDNAKAFKHDSVISKDSVPTESKDKLGFFNVDFNNFITKAYKESTLNISQEVA